ncbi:glycosyltransferase [Gelidibacter mesophilus]|uniref:glycosyltransferase n=1 Tax=Gelidibacter mesophilus TaxID=169050 RepID=UPI00040B100A|nr:glycosyltransferase [Gelidibacter mesophilus]
MRLSIIIPVYNAEKHLSRCLNSLLDQGLPDQDFEILIINDGSTDESLKIAEQYALDNSSIKVINKENGGAGIARNLGMARAVGDYIYFIDADDYLMPNSLDKLLTRCESNNLDMLTFISKSSYSSNLKSAIDNHDFNSPFGDAVFSPILTGEEYIASINYRNEVWWFLVRREFLINSGKRFLEGRWLEDIIFSLELILEAKRIAHLSLDVHRQVVTEGSAMTNVESEHYLNIIRDMQFAAMNFQPIIEKLENKNASVDCIKRVKARQQSLVFFSMIRMLQSNISFDEVKTRTNEMMRVDAYPLDSFLGKDYNIFRYQFLTRLFKNEKRFYFIFKMFNPILKSRKNLIYSV